MKHKQFARYFLAYGLITIMSASLGHSLPGEKSLSFSCGIITLDQAADILSDVMTAAITAGTYQKNYTSYSPAWFVTYHTSPNGRFGYGGTIGTYSSKGDLVISSNPEWTFTEKSTIVAAEADYRWIKKRSFQLYSGLGVGVRFRHGAYGADKPGTKVYPTFHFNLIGFRVGTRLGVFGDAGVGYKGILSLGVNYQF